MIVNAVETVPPPGVAFVTITRALPAVVSWAAGIVAVICVAVSTVKEIATGAPAPAPSASNVTVVTPLMKFVPVIVMAVSPAPFATVFGLTFVTVGAGLFTVTLTVGLDGDAA